MKIVAEILKEILYNTKESFMLPIDGYIQLIISFVFLNATKEKLKNTFINSIFK